MSHGGRHVDVGKRPGAIYKRLQAYPWRSVALQQLAKHVVNIDLRNLLAEWAQIRLNPDEHQETVSKIRVGEQTQAMLGDDVGQSVHLGERVWWVHTPHFEQGENAK